MRGLRRVLLCFCLTLLAAGCAATYAPPGPGGAVSQLTERAFVTEDGLRLPTRVWLPEDGSGEAPKAVILALHGFNDYSRAFDSPASAWADRGIATYAYDQRGFGAGPNAGLWPGIDALQDDVQTFLALLRARYPDTPIYLLGESMGAAVVAVTLADPQPLEIAGAILSAPAVWARDAQPWYQRAALWTAVRLFPGWTPSGADLGIQASDNIEMLIALGRDPLVIKQTRIDAVAGLVDLMDAALAAAPRINRRLLVLAGAEDQLIPWPATRWFLRGLPEAAAGRQDFAYYEDGWHMLLRDLRAEVPIGDVANWILTPEERLPSGALAAGKAKLTQELEPSEEADAAAGDPARLGRISGHAR